MTDKLAHLFRSMVALVLVGFGAYSLFEIGHSAMKSNADWFLILMDAFFFFVLVLVPVGMGYLVYRRRYHELCSVLAMLASIVIFFYLMHLPHQFGWYHVLDWLDKTTSTGLPGLFILLLFLFGPFFAAAWFHRMCIRLADRYLPPSKPRRWPATNAVTEK